MKSLIKQVPLRAMIAVPMGALVVFGIVLSWKATDLWQDVGLNLTFMGLGTLITVFYVDFVLESDRNLRWAGAKAAVDVRIRRAAAGFLRSADSLVGLDLYQNRFFIPAWHDKVDPLDSLRELFSKPEWLVYLKEEVSKNLGKLSNLDSDGELDRLLIALDLYESRLRETVVLSQGRLSAFQMMTIATVLDEIIVQRHYVRVQRAGNQGFLPPDFRELFLNSISLVEESNRNPNAYLPTIAERNSQV